MKIGEVVTVINKEIQWCQDNPMPDHVTKDYREGFIKGLEQAKALIIEASRLLEAEKKA